MKNAVIMLLILIFSILIYGIVQLKKNDTPIVNTPAASSATIQNHLPQPDYSEAVMPEDKLPESEEVIVINEEQK